jgi:hypothetical protein
MGVHQSPHDIACAVPRRSICAAIVVVVALALGAATTAQARLVFERGGSVWAAYNDGSGARRLTTGGMPVISPNGEWIAFQRDATKKGSTDLRFVRAGGGPSRFGGHDVLDSGVWAPSSSFYVSIGADAFWWASPRMASRPRVIANYLDHDEECGAAVAPDGRVAYSDCGDLVVLPRTLRHAGARHLGNGAAPVWGAAGLAFSDTIADPKGNPANFVSSTLKLLAPSGAIRVLYSSTTSGVDPRAVSRSGTRILVKIDAATAILDLGGQPQPGRRRPARLRRPGPDGPPRRSGRPSGELVGLLVTAPGGIAMAPARRPSAPFRLSLPGRPPDAAPPDRMTTLVSR